MNPDCQDLHRDPAPGPTCSAVAAVLQRLGPHPTAEEVAWLWHTAFETVESLSKAGRSEKRTKRALIEFLAPRAPFLARHAAGLRWTFNRKLKHWRLHGRVASCLLDGRLAANARRVKQLPAPDFKTVVEVAASQFYGDVAPAFRYCKQNNLLTRGTDSEFAINWADKSRIPESWMRDLKPAARNLTQWYHSPRQARLNGPDLLQNHDEYFAGDWFTSDDKTLDVLFAIPAKAKSGWKVMQGQFLPLADEKSKFILGWNLTRTEQYTAVDIKVLNSKVCREHGLPNAGWVTECGLWERSRLVGARVPWGEQLFNFADHLGLKIKQASPGNAKGKLIENILGLLDRHLRGELCWAGHDQRKMKIERAQRARLDVESGRKSPAEAGMLTYDQWCSRLREIVDRYNHEPQDSKVMGCVMSPAQAWIELRQRDAAGKPKGQTKLPLNCAWLLDTQRETRTYTRNGILIPKSFLGAQRDAYYASEETSQFMGREVNVSFSPEFPEFVTILSRDLRQQWIVPRRHEYQRHSADSESYTRAKGSVTALSGYWRGWVQTMRSKFGDPAATPVLAAASTQAVGEALRQAEAKVTEARHSRQRAQSRVSKLARQAGLNPDAVKDGRAIELLNQGLADES